MSKMKKITNKVMRKMTINKEMMMKKMMIKI